MKTYGSKASFDEILFPTHSKTRISRLGIKTAYGLHLTYEEARKLQNIKMAFFFTNLVITSKIMNSIRVINAPLCVILCTFLLLHIQKVKYFNLMLVNEVLQL